MSVCSWLVYTDPGFGGFVGVLEVGEYPCPEAWGFPEPFVGSLRPLRMVKYRKYTIWCYAVWSATTLKPVKFITVECVRVGYIRKQTWFQTQKVRKSSVSRNIAVFILVIEQCLISVSTGGSNVVADLWTFALYCNSSSYLSLIECVFITGADKSGASQWSQGLFCSTSHL